MTHFAAPTRRRSFLLLLVALLAFRATAQQIPQIAKVSATRSNSTFLLGFYPTASKTQSLYLPADLPGGSAGSIPRLYFMYGSTGITTGTTLTNLTIKLGQTTAIGFVGGNTFFADTSLTTVLTSASYTIAPGPSGTWFSIDLDTPFAYDPTQTLILQITFTGSTATNFGTFGDPNNGKKMYADTPGATTGNPSSSTWQHFGFDVSPLGLTAEAGASVALQAFPNPAHEALWVRLADALLPAHLQLLDALGRPVRELQFSASDLRAGRTLPLQGVAAGSYLLSVQQGERRLVRRVVVE